MGAELISCHVGWSEQANSKTPNALLARVHRALRVTDVQIIAMGGLKPDSVPMLLDYDRLFAIVAGSSITRSPDPAATVTAFQDAIRTLWPYRSDTAA